MIDRSPEVDHLAVELHLHFIQVPAPLASAAHSADPLASEVTDKHWADPVPLHLHRLMANAEAALEEQELEVPQWKGDRTFIITTNRIASGQ